MKTVVAPESCCCSQGDWDTCRGGQNDTLHSRKVLVGGRVCLLEHPIVEVCFIISSRLARFSKLCEKTTKARNNHLGGQGNEVSGTGHPVLGKRIHDLLACSEQFWCI